jgi:hypothetical protein
MTAKNPSHHTLMDRLLRPLSNVRPGEGVLAVLMLVCAFLILTSYYVIPPRSAFSRGTPAARQPR